MKRDEFERIKSNRKSFDYNNNDIKECIGKPAWFWQDDTHPLVLNILQPPGMIRGRFRAQNGYYDYFRPVTKEEMETLLNGGGLPKV